MQKHQIHKALFISQERQLREKLDIIAYLKVQIELILYLKNRLKQICCLLQKAAISVHSVYLLEGRL